MNKLERSFQQYGNFLRLLSIGHLDRRFGLCLSLFPETVVLLFMTLVPGFFLPLCLVWDFAMTFREFTAKLHFMRKLRLPHHWNTSLYEKYTEEQQARLEEGKTAQASSPPMDYNFCLRPD